MIAPETILLNGKIHTLGPNNELVDALAIFAGKIVQVGTDREIESLRGPETRIIDLMGRTTVPGLVDVHVHASGAGVSLKYWIDCSELQSIEEIQSAVKTRAKELGAGKWIMGNGYDEFKLVEGRPPNKDDLDKVSPENPCVISRRDGHVLTVNSRVLLLAGIDRSTPDPEGGKIYRNSDGESTGIHAENAQKLLADILPRPSIDELKEGLIAAQKKLASWGMTGYDEALATRDDVKAYQELRNEGRLLLRVGLILAANFVGVPIAQDAIRAGVQTNFGDEWIGIVGAKLITDGSMASGTAAVYDPYPGTESNGILLMEKEELAAKINELFSAGLRPCIHAIGDRAVDLVVDLVQDILRQNGTMQDHRIRIEHCGLVSDATLEKVKSLGICVSSSIGFLYNLGDSHLKLLGNERLYGYYRGRSYVDKGIIAAGNSDWNVTPANPLLGIYGLVTRRTSKGKTIGENEKLSLKEALEFYTKNSAYLDFQEKLKGTLEMGKFADITVFEEDIFAMDEDKMRDAKVYMTIVSGKIIYDSRETPR
jgi:predicted amidohydrolase YtcJ